MKYVMFLAILHYKRYAFELKSLVHPCPSPPPQRLLPLSNVMILYSYIEGVLSKKNPSE